MKRDFEQPPSGQEDIMERTFLLELLSERLLAEYPVDVWREVFVRAGQDNVRFEHRVVTYLSVAGLLPDWTKSALRGAARRNGGHVESFGPPTTFAFREARQALKLALQLQTESAHCLGAAILTARCTTALFLVDGCEGSLGLGCESRLVADRAAATSPGSVYVSGEAYPLIARLLERHENGPMVTRELHGGTVTSALITYPPARETGISTFAALGLTPRRKA